MGFRDTPLNISTLLLVALAVVVMIVLIKKRYDTNLGLIFYLTVLIFTNTTDRELNPMLLYFGLVLALLLRFEFMGTFITKAVVFLELAALVMICWSFLIDVFGPGLSPF
jgi:hypothetical protein